MWCRLVDSYLSVNPALSLYLAKASILVIDAWYGIEFVANARSLLFNLSRYGLRKDSTFDLFVKINRVDCKCDQCKKS